VKAYEAGEKAQHATYLIIQVKDTTNKIDEVNKIHSNLLRAGLPAPEIRVMDGRPKESASKPQ
jgi:hypothetical protein